MGRHGRRVIGWAMAAAVCVPGTAAASGLRPAAAPVPPTQEIELLDPGVDPTGKPAVVVRPGPGGQQVDIPPAVLVHKFYYTGDRTFQGPMLPGGPMIVAVNHPKTLERVYVPVTLPPGAPRVTYTSHAIRYDYGPQTVSVVFGVCGKPTVKYSQGTVAGERVKEAAGAVVADTRSLIQRTGIPDGVHRAAQGTKAVVVKGADLVNAVGRVALTPIAKLLPSGAEPRPARDPINPPADPDFTFVPRTP